MGLAVVLCALAVFWPVVRSEFLRWDDWDTVANNPTFNPVSLKKVGQTWTQSRMSLYAPMTYTVWGIAAAISPRHAPDDEGITLDPHLFHSINLVLHCISALVAFLALREMFRADWAALVGALFFALHPVQVEPVAWMSGMKDVLCGCFALVAIWQYVVFTKQSTLKAGIPHYVIAFVFFILAMLAKPAAVTLPLVLMMIDWIILRRDWEQIGLSLLPMALVTVPIVVIGLIYQPAATTQYIPLMQRPFVAGDAIAFYLLKIIWPWRLTTDYGRNPPWLIGQGALMYQTTLLAAVVIGLSVAWFKKFPVLACGIGVLLAAVLPVLGFLPFEFQYYSTVADHYLYLAIFGVGIIVSGAMLRWRTREMQIGAAIILLLFAVRSFTQIAHWRNMQTLTQHVVSIDPQSLAGYRAEAFMRSRKGDYVGAIELYQESLKNRPDDVETHYNFANMLLKYAVEGRARKTVLREQLQALLNVAVEHYAYALNRMPKDPSVPNNLSIALQHLEKYDDAEAVAREALRRDPRFAKAHANLGHLLMMSGRFDGAAAEFNEALKIDPQNEDARRGLSELEKQRATQK